MCQFAARQLGVGQAGARLGHLGQPEVDRITEDCGQQQRPVFGLGPVLQGGEVAAEARPVVHVHQQFGDLDARSNWAGLVDQRLRSIRHRRIQRGDFQP